MHGVEAQRHEAFALPLTAYIGLNSIERAASEPEPSGTLLERLKCQGLTDSMMDDQFG